jgi:excinuclease ABC subunit B
VYDTESSQLQQRAAQARSSYASMNEKELTREFQRVEKEMLEYARNLDFERAAELRDRLKLLKQRFK